MRREISRFLEDFEDEGRRIVDGQHRIAPRGGRQRLPEKISSSFTARLNAAFVAASTERERPVEV
jgi:hypothetical protein